MMLWNDHNLKYSGRQSGVMHSIMLLNGQQLPHLLKGDQQRKRTINFLWKTVSKKIGNDLLVLIL